MTLYVILSILPVSAPRLCFLISENRLSHRRTMPSVVDPDRNKINSNPIHVTRSFFSWFRISKSQLVMTRRPKSKCSPNRCPSGYWEKMCCKVVQMFGGCCFFIPTIIPGDRPMFFHWVRQIFCTWKCDCSVFLMTLSTWNSILLLVCFHFSQLDPLLNWQIVQLLIVSSHQRHNWKEAGFLSALAKVKRVLGSPIFLSTSFVEPDTKTCGIPSEERQD